LAKRLAVFKPSQADNHRRNGDPNRHPPSGLRRHRRDDAVRQRELRGEDQRQGGKLIWLDVRAVDKLSALRGKGESYGDVIVRLSLVER
jgi:hypothetical protein